jgi:hypothetical protein
MFYPDRLIDECETHQRTHTYLKDELCILVADATVKRLRWLKAFWCVSETD